MSDWKELVFEKMQESHDNDRVVFPTSYMLGALIRMLHDKKIISDEDREFLGRIWDWEPQGGKNPGNDQTS